MFTYHKKKKISLQDFYKLDIDYWNLLNLDLETKEPISTRIDYECLKLKLVDGLSHREIGELVHKSSSRVG